MSRLFDGPRVLSALLGLAGGFLLALLLLIDPLGLHLLDDHLAGVEASDDHGRHGHSEPRNAVDRHPEPELWTCGMHPHVIQDEPGQCPICHMDLVAVRDEAPAARDERQVLFYRHPTDPNVTSPAPAKDSLGVDYLPVYDEPSGPPGGADGAPVAVRIDPAVVQNMNVRTEPAARRDLQHDIRTVGSLEYDQQRMVTVTTKYAGWVEKVYVNYIGEPVRRGQPLFEIYSPELLQTVQELLSALEFARRMGRAPEGSRRRAEALVEATRRRLAYWDISAEQIAELERTGKVFRTLTVTAPSSGVVMKRMAGLEGMAVEPGMQTFHIANLSRLWLSVEVFEDQVAWIREGTRAKVTFSYFPGQTFDGTVRFLEPALSEQTRTLQVKLEVPNRDGRLRAGMFATVELAPIAVENALTVPSGAVLRTGQRNLVVVARGEGLFAPQEVELGHERRGYAEVLSGLTEGDRVVTSAQFLLDSESSLREAVQKMVAQAGHHVH